MAAIPCSAIFWVWTLTLSPAAVNNCWIAISSAGGPAVTVGAVRQRKKNARHNRPPTLLTGARYGRRSHDRLALVAPHHHQNLRGTPRPRHGCLPQYRRAAARPNGLFATRESQTNLHQPQPPSKPPVRIPRRFALPFPAPSSAHH